LKTRFLDKKFAYDGSQLRSLFAYLSQGLLGTSAIAWIGPCSIPFSHMVDGEDLLAKAEIKGDEMLHFVVEIFDRELFSAVSLQRLFASMAKDYLQSHCSGFLTGKRLYRDGDDIYFEDRKLSISIASQSPISVMIHFAINISNAGTPVKTASLEDFKLDAEVVALDLLELLKLEYESIVEATQKVRPLN
jgi:hypothetical protein